MSPIDAYLELRREIDRRCDLLFRRFAPAVECRRGCSRCCTHIAVLPLEFDRLRRIPEIRQKMEEASPDDPHRCPLLEEHACGIYGERPLICRVFGLPQLWRIEEWGPEARLLPQSDWDSALDWCELNFTAFDPERDRESFRDEELIDMYALNYELLRLNRLFCATPEGKGYQAELRIPLGSLIIG